MINPTTWVGATFAVCLLMTVPVASQEPAPAQQAAPQKTTSDVRTGATEHVDPAPPPSDELVKQPQTPGATGDQQRHYYFAEAKTESPYHIYVPKNYDGKTKLPLILALHGAGGYQNYFFQANYGMPDLMEKYDFIFVEPLGYDSFGGYGATNLPRVKYETDAKAPVYPINARRPHWTPEEAQHVTELSEKDVMNVLALVEKEYTVDMSRVYLMGHSMGGSGTWYLGQKYADKWAGLGVMSGGFGFADYPLQKLKGMPIIVTAGGRDTAVHGPQAQAEVARFKSAGLDITYIEAPYQTHMGNIPFNFPQVIDFLATHQRKGN